MKQTKSNTATPTSFMLLTNLTDGTTHRVILDNRQWARLAKWMSVNLPAGLAIDPRAVDVTMRDAQKRSWWRRMADAVTRHGAAY